MPGHNSTRGKAFVRGCAKIFEAGPRALRPDPRERLPVLKCTGAVSIISFEGEPAPIPEQEIDGIRRLVQSDLAYDPCPMIREGMMVEVVHGPLSGVIGRLVRKNDKARLVLSVDLIGQAVSVEVDAADVRAY